MTHSHPSWAWLIALALATSCALVACGDDEEENNNSGDTTTSTTGSDTTGGGGTTGDTTTGGTTTGGTTTDDFVFSEKALGDYTQIDRMGMPAVATALVTEKDAYNSADPVADVNGDFVPEIVANLTALHGALDDDLTGLGLTPCDTDTCVNQGAPLVVPDTLKIDPSTASGFPNGRRLADPVMDVTLAVVLLDLSVHDVTTFVGLLNPTENDKPFQDTFPYLAEPTAP